LAGVAGPEPTISRGSKPVISAFAYTKLAGVTGLDSTISRGSKLVISALASIKIGWGNWT